SLCPYPTRFRSVLSVALPAIEPERHVRRRLSHPVNLPGVDLPENVLHLLDICGLAAFVRLDRGVKRRTLSGPRGRFLPHPQTALEMVRVRAAFVLGDLRHRAVVVGHLSTSTVGQAYRGDVPYSSRPRSTIRSTFR